MYKKILVSIMLMVFGLSTVYGQTAQKKQPQQSQVTNLQENTDFVAIITRLSGKVLFQRKKDTVKWEKAKLNLPLYEGDKIKTEESSQATLWLRIGGIISVNQKETLVVTVPQEKKAEPLFSNLWEAFTRKIRRSQVREELDSMLVIKSYDSAYKIDVLSPRNTKLLAAPTVFEWTPVSDAKEYVLTIGYFSGMQKIWQTKVNDTMYSFENKTLPEFIMGKPYLWEIEAYNDEGQPIASDSTWFTIMTEGERDAIKNDVELITQSASNDKATVNLLLAAFYEDNELYWESERLLKELLKDVDQPIIHLMLGDLYLKLGLVKQSLRETQNGSEITQ